MYKFIYRSLQLCRRELSLLRGVRTLTSVSSLIFKPPTFVRSTSRLPSISSHSGVRGLWGSPVLAGSPADLDKAREMLNSLTEDPGNETKLKMYALFKQGTLGPCSTDRPGMMDFVGRAKWDAWNSLGNISQSDAIEQYCQIVNELVASATPPMTNGSSNEETTSPSSSDYKMISLSQEGGLLTITLNRPTKFNAINYQMYSEWKRALVEAGDNNSVVVAMITGEGDYYCSGNDLSNFANIPPEGPKKLAADAKEILREFVSSFINFPKPLIAAVNGPAIGVSVTVLALCDLVYASDKATFHTPFMSLGQSPEGCSSMLFPRIMGAAKANEILLAGRKLTAQEACERNLVTQVLPASQFREKVNEIATTIAKLPPQSLSKSKQLIREQLMDDLERANVLECELLEERWVSEECAKAIINFMTRKN